MPEVQRASSSSDTRNWVLFAFIALLLGLEILVVPLAGLYLSWTYRSVPYRSSLLLPIAALVLALAAATVIGVVRDGAYDRALSSVYSIGILVGGTLLAIGIIKHLYRQAQNRRDPRDFREVFLGQIGMLSHRLLLFCLLLFGVGVLAFAVTGSEVLSFPTLLSGFADSDTEMLRYLASTRIYRPDWGFGSFAAPRFIYFARWDTAGAIIVSLTGNLAAAHFWAKGRKRDFVLTEAITILLIVSTLSRTVIGIHIGVSVLTYLWISRNRMVLGSLLLVLASILAGLLPLLADFASSFRQYSTSDRFELYGAALSQFIAGDPLLGLGYKPKDDPSLQYAVGSHSMPLSFLTRGGLIALIFATLAFWILPIARGVRSVLSHDPFKRKTAPFWVRGIVVVGAWSLFQEIDTSILTYTAIIIFLLSVDLLSRRTIAIHPR
ncbi:hypothetical protein NO932_17915 [Pelagibacterium sp. 26DY04]|uniref:O-antigen ligase family protein n=1 Tax=Pelagibacterium sp. 26DY04 TaxID=2967130 RepID=UPI00281516F0|nr:O-antigen ligase family protein [Pelagibacterium sp. 26DY04]WMT86752.1 hypothetical protein NO932_17915 [Pelagibacterium sp. 26DY04]